MNVTRFILGAVGIIARDVETILTKSQYLRNIWAFFFAVSQWRQWQREAPCVLLGVDTGRYTQLCFTVNLRKRCLSSGRFNNTDKRSDRPPLPVLWLQSEQRTKADDGDSFTRLGQTSFHHFFFSSLIHSIPTLFHSPHQLQWVFPLFVLLCFFIRLSSKWIQGHPLTRWCWQIVSHMVTSDQDPSKIPGAHVSQIPDWGLEGTRFSSKQRRKTPPEKYCYR